jgi:hypothetical protein
VSDQSKPLIVSIKLLGAACTLDGKRYVNDAIGVVIERVGHHVRTLLDISDTRLCPSYQLWRKLSQGFVSALVDTANEQGLVPVDCRVNGYSRPLW